MKKSDTIIHIKLDADEAIQSRKDVLNTQVDLIKIAQGVKNYRALRLRELQLKIELYKKLKETQADINSIKKVLPEIQIPKILKKHEEEMHKEIVIKELKPIEEIKEEKPKKTKGKTKKEKKTEEKPKKDPELDSLEAQLRKIQDKLNNLE